jgi:hypothetical protein
MMGLMPDQPSPRSAHQFSLRTLFVVTTILAIAAWIIRLAGPVSIPPVLLALCLLSRKLSRKEAGAETGIRWKRVFFWALASLATCGVANSLILSQLPTGGADLRPYNPESVEILRGISDAVVSAGVLGFFAAIFGMLGWSATGR